MISKEKWDELKSDWQRYGKEYLAVGVFCLFFLLGVWFLVFKPAMDDDHENDLLNLKTELLQKIKNNSVELSFLNETEAKKQNQTLKKFRKMTIFILKTSSSIKRAKNSKSKSNLKAQTELRFSLCSNFIFFIATLCVSFKIINNLTSNISISNFFDTKSRTSINL